MKKVFFLFALVTLISATGFCGYQNTTEVTAYAGQTKSGTVDVPDGYGEYGMRLLAFNSSYGYIGIYYGSSRRDYVVLQAWPDVDGYHSITGDFYEGTATHFSYYLRPATKSGSFVKATMSW